MIDPDRFATMRAAMVASQLRTNGVADPVLIAALTKVPRHAFVNGPWQDFAYADASLPIADGRVLNPPLATALLIHALDLQRNDRVLIVGAATGYAAALVLELSNRVTLVECDAALAGKASEAIPGATVITGPLESGAPNDAPYDAILIDGAAEAVPDALVDQLAEHGRLAAGIVDHGVTRLALGHRAAHGLRMVPFVDSDIGILPGFARPRAFVF